MRRFLAVTAAVAVLSGAFVQAQEATNVTGEEATKTLLTQPEPRETDVRPIKPYEAALRVPGRPDGVEIIRQSGDNTAERGSSVAYGVSPLWAIIPGEDSKNPWLTGKRVNEAMGSVSGKMVVAVLPPEVCAQAEAIILHPKTGDIAYLNERALSGRKAETPATLAHLNGESRKDLFAIIEDPLVPTEAKLKKLRELGIYVSVFALPLEHVAVVCYDFRTGEIFATLDARYFHGPHEKIELPVTISKASFEKMAEAHEKGDLVFTYHYSYSGRHSESAKVERKGHSETDFSDLDKQTSDQLSGAAPVFQGQEVQLASVVNTKVVANYFTSNQALLPLLKLETTVALLFEPSTNMLYREIEGDELARTAFLSFVTPALERTRNQGATISLDTHTTEDENTRALRAGGGFGFIIQVSGEAEEIKRKLDQFTKETGITTQYDKERKGYVPHSVRVKRVRKGWQDRILEETMAVTIGTGPNVGYHRSSAIPSSFVLDSAIVAKKLEDLRLARRVKEKELYDLFEALVSEMRAGQHEYSSMEGYFKQLGEWIPSVQSSFGEIRYWEGANMDMHWFLAVCEKEYDYLGAKMRDWMKYSAIGGNFDRVHNSVSMRQFSKLFREWELPAHNAYRDKAIAENRAKLAAAEQGMQVVKNAYAVQHNAVMAHAQTAEAYAAAYRAKQAEIAELDLQIRALEGK